MLKDELIGLLDEYVGMAMTRKNIDEMHDQLRFFFESNGLEHFKYRLQVTDEKVIIIPIRIIDKYALKGILEE